ncbi:MAG: DUF2891 family protein [Steroidobacteraceae bacterium]
MAADTPPELASLRAARPAMVRALVVASERCVERTDTSHPVFHGCIDWHSAAHGIWSLVAAGDMLHEQRLVDRATELLPVAGIAQERAYLREHPEFEMPYGRSWFLRLAADFESVTHDTRLRAMADEVAASLVDRFVRAHVNSVSQAYSSASWALINLRYYALFSGNTALVHDIDARIDEDFGHPSGVCPGLEQDRQMHDFMPICTNWAWLISSRLSAQQYRDWVHGFLPAASLPAPVQAPSTAHEHGLNFSRAWGLWAIYQRSQDVAYLRAYQQHLQASFEHPDWWTGTYDQVGHWVAQFGILALYLPYRDSP